MKTFLQCISSGKYSPLFIVCLAVILLVMALGLAVFSKINTDPDIIFLISEQGAEWIRFREPLVLSDKSPQKLVTGFRTTFSVTQKIPGNVMLSLRAMRRAAVWLDDKVLFVSDTSRSNEWKKKYTIDLTPYLSPGNHELRISVINQNGHPAVIAYSEPLKLYTGGHWEASVDGKAWSKSLPLNEKIMPSLSFKFQRADKALISNLPIFLPLFLLVCLFSFTYKKWCRINGRIYYALTPGTVRWILLGAFVILGINNIGKIPLYVGMDYSDHMDYITYVAKYWRIPLATDGWQMFQPPLYYLFSAVIYKYFFSYVTLETIGKILRVLPILCGAAQVELCYRTLRCVYPDRDDLQIIGMLIGSLLPMNIYISQVIGNEPMAGCLTGMVVFLLIRLLCDSSQTSMKIFIITGAFLGLAMLTKITAILLVPPLMGVIVLRSIDTTTSWGNNIALSSKRICMILVTAFIISGWYYLRNWIEMGQFFIGGWDTARNIMWWQDPGYRTPQQFYTYGESLFHPVCSAFMGIWDGMYSTLWMDGYLCGMINYPHIPPWNYDFMLSNAWLSIVPSVALVLGIFVSLKNHVGADRRILYFSTSCVVMYLFAMLYIFLTVPIYSTTKATYALGITPCFVILCTAGFEILIRRPVFRAVVFGGIACWAFASYAAYFVL